jgi:hypothetical protein
VTIVTGDEFNAGTNASVSIVLYGASLPCGPHFTLHIACFTRSRAVRLPRDGARLRTGTKRASGVIRLSRAMSAAVERDPFEAGATDTFKLTLPASLGHVDAVRCGIAAGDRHRATDTVRQTPCSRHRATHTVQQTPCNTHRATDNMSRSARRVVAVHASSCL